MAIRKCLSWYICRNHKYSQLKDDLGALWISCYTPIVIMPYRCLNTADIQFISTYIYLQVNWSWVSHTDDMEWVIPLPAKWHMSIWTYSDLKNINLQDLHQIHIKSKFLDLVMDLKQDDFIHMKVLCLKFSNCLSQEGRSMVVRHVLMVHTCSFLCTCHIGMTVHVPAYLWVGNDSRNFLYVHNTSLSISGSVTQLGMAWSWVTLT